MRSMVWLASYPKSGNTWFRAFLANYQRDGEEPAHINRLNTGGMAGARELFDEFSGVNAADLTLDEVDALRPAVYRKWAETHDDVSFHKIHDAYTTADRAQPVVPPDVTRGALYFIRNPLDVVVSYAHHAATDVATVIDWMADPHHAFAYAPGRLHGQLRQRMCTWSGHVRSWVDQSDFPVHVVRYEDMHDCAGPTFAAAIAFAGLEANPARVQRAIARADFAELHRQEAADGFVEKSPVSESFFRKGEVGAWRGVLSEADVARVIEDHGEIMRRFGFIDGAGHPVSR